jgi:hypothetical protein
MRRVLEDPAYVSKVEGGSSGTRRGHECAVETEYARKMATG